MRRSVITRVSAAACTALLLASGATVTASAQPATAPPASTANVPDKTDKQAEIQAALDYTARFTEPTVEHSEDGNQVVVSFSDTVDGATYRYTYERDASSQAEAEALDPQEPGPVYIWTRTGWILNRAETDDLSRDGAMWAGLYSIAAALGVGAPAVIGAAIEGNWAARAASYYSHGNCAKVYYWLWISEVEYGSRGCQ